MKKKKHSFLFSIDHFYKISIGLGLLWAVSIFGIYFFLFRTDRSLKVQETLYEETVQIANHIERKVITIHRNMLNNYIEKHRNGYAVPEKNMSAWLNQHPSAISMTYIDSRNQPVQKIRDHLMDLVPMSDNPLLQQDIYSYLYIYKGMYLTGNSQMEWKTFQTNEGPLILMTYIRRDSISKDIFEGTFLLSEALFEQAAGNLALRRLAFASATGHIVWQNAALDWPVVLNPKQRVLIEAETFFCQQPFNRMPLTLVLAPEKPLASVLSPLSLKFLILFPIVILLFAALIGAVVTYFIDRPLKPFLDTVVELSRGNYNLRLPEQKNKSTSRLARLINYMIEEMAYMQKINVGKIINEKNKTETILRNIADGVVVTDTDNHIVVVNKVAEKWFHLTEKDVMDQPINKNIHNGELLNMLRKLKNGSDQASVEFKHRLYETGEMKVLQAHAANIHNQENQTVGIVTVLRDVTQSREADRVKTELVSMVAHELKSPLTSIYGYSEMLLKSRIESVKALEYARTIMSESSRLTDFVNKFLDLSRIESGKTQMQMVPIDMVQIIRKITKNHRHLADKKHIEVILELPNQLGLALGDQEMVEQVVLNLFSNAIKYSPKQAKIGIEARDKDDVIHVDVTDSGYGIAQSMLPKIFDKFYRIKDEDGHDVEGAGLGLALVKEIIERHHGSVSVKSTVGVGSVFSFTLPKYKM